MNSNPTKVLITKTWDGVRRHSVYSCPDTPDYDFVLGAEHLLLHSRTLNESEARWVDSTIRITNLSEEPVPIGLRSRFNAYKGIVVPSTLCGDRHRFYFLFPKWLQSIGETRTPENHAALSIWQERHKFFKWPIRSALLKPGWIRHRDGSRSDCYSYDSALKKKLASKQLSPDGRNNGPAILAFQMAGGLRPSCGAEGWPIHHIYDGVAQHPLSRRTIMHAVKNGEFFTHSGGLVAAHPAAHYIAHHSSLLGWLLRWEAYKRFAFDPDGIFQPSAP